MKFHRTPPLLLILAIPLFGQEDKSAKAVAEAKEFFKGFEKAEVTFFQLDPRTDGRADKAKQKLFWSWIILQEKALKEDKSVEDLKEVLADPKSFGGPAFDCFDPGLAFRFKLENDVGEMVICLACSRIYSHRGEKKYGWELSREGGRRLMKIYRVHVPEDKAK